MRYQPALPSLLVSSPTKASISPTGSRTYGYLTCFFINSPMSHGQSHYLSGFLQVESPVFHHLTSSHLSFTFSIDPQLQLDFLSRRSAMHQAPTNIARFNWLLIPSINTISFQHSETVPVILVPAHRSLQIRNRGRDNQGMYGMAHRFTQRNRTQEDCSNLSQTHTNTHTHRQVSHHHNRLIRDKTLSHASPQE